MAYKVLYCDYLRAARDSQAGWIVCTEQSHIARPQRAVEQTVPIAATCLRKVTHLALEPRLLPFSRPWPGAEPEVVLR